MTPRQTLAAVFTLSAAVLAGCGIADDSSGGAKDDAKVSVATPRDTLIQAVPDAKEGPYRFAVKGNETPLSGVLDAPKKTLQATFVQSEPGLTLTMTTLVVGPKGWIKMSFKPANLPGLPKLPKKWLLLDQSRIKDKTAKFEYGDETDPGYTSLLVQSAAGITETSPGHFAGTVDLTQATAAEIVDDATLKALGAKAKALPFTAVVAGGHLSSLAVKIPAAGKKKASTYAVSYTGFGATPSPAVPAAGEQTPATPAVYDLLNG
jgi:hypothetical protein